MTPRRFCQGAFARPAGQQQTGMNEKQKEAESISIISASAAWSADVNQTERGVGEQRTSRHRRTKGRRQSMLSVLPTVEGLAGITSTDGAVAHVARLAGAQVSSDGVGADGVLIAQILAAGALVVL